MYKNRTMSTFLIVTLLFSDGINVQCLFNLTSLVGYLG